MESPPPYMPPRKKSNTGLIVGLIIGGVVLCCIGPIALLVGGGLWGFNKIKPMIQCGATFAVARDAVRDYAKDHDGKLPKAETWMDDVRTYYSKEWANDDSPFKALSADEVWSCDDGNGGRTGIAFNSDLSGKEESAVGREEALIFEIRQAAANASQKYEKLSFADSPKMFGEHRGWFVAYAEGAPGIYDKRDRFTPVEARGPRRR